MSGRYLITDRCAWNFLRKFRVGVWTRVSTHLQKFLPNAQIIRKYTHLIKGNSEQEDYSQWIDYWHLPTLTGLIGVPRKKFCLAMSRKHYWGYILLHHTGPPVQQCQPPPDLVTRNIRLSMPRAYVRPSPFVPAIYTYSQPEICSVITLRYLAPSWVEENSVVGKSHWILCDFEVESAANIFHKHDQRLGIAWMEEQCVHHFASQSLEGACQGAS